VIKIHQEITHVTSPGRFAKIILEPEMTAKQKNKKIHSNQRSPEIRDAQQIWRNWPGEEIILYIPTHQQICKFNHKIYFLLPMHYCKI